MAEARITRDDVTSMVEARRELGEEMEPAVVDAFLERDLQHLLVVSH